MTPELHRINDRQRPSLLDADDALRVESRAISYADMRQETTIRLRIENALLRDQIERLRAENATLATLVPTNGQVADEATTMLQTSESRRHEAEGWTWFWFLAWVGTLALAVIAAAFVIWD